jgi:hypothetical protein
MHLASCICRTECRQQCPFCSKCYTLGATADDKGSRHVTVLCLTAASRHGVHAGMAAACSRTFPPEPAAAVPWWHGSYVLPFAAASGHAPITPTSYQHTCLYACVCQRVTTGQELVRVLFAWNWLCLQWYVLLPAGLPTQRLLPRFLLLGGTTKPLGSRPFQPRCSLARGEEVSSRCAGIESLADAVFEVSIDLSVH